MNDFSDFLKKEKQSVLEKKDISYTFINKILVLIEKINHILLDPFMWEIRIFYAIIVVNMAIWKVSVMWKEI